MGSACARWHAQESGASILGSNSSRILAAAAGEADAAYSADATAYKGHYGDDGQSYAEHGDEGDERACRSAQERVDERRDEVDDAVQIEEAPALLVRRRAMHTR